MTSSMSMRERIARALYNATPFKETAGGYEAQSSTYQRMCLLLADAVLAEMMEPTKAMLDAAATIDGMNADPEWRAMIQAARDGK